MPKARPLNRPDEASHDAGTLWKMNRNGWIARCALWSFADRWELRVTVDAELLFAKRGADVPDLFKQAEVWKARLADSGWAEITSPARMPATRITPAPRMPATIG